MRGDEPSVHLSPIDKRRAVLSEVDAAEGFWLEGGGAVPRRPGSLIDFTVETKAYAF